MLIDYLADYTINSGGRKNRIIGTVSLAGRDAVFVFPFLNPIVPQL